MRFGATDKMTWLPRTIRYPSHEPLIQLFCRAPGVGPTTFLFVYLACWAVIVPVVGSKSMHQPRIMYIERKDDGVTGPGRIGRVTFSKSGRTLYYRGQTFKSCDGAGSKCNYFDAETEIGYWISGCKKDGRDRLYPGIIEIDDDVREEYWTGIRGMPERKAQRVIRCSGKYGGKNAGKI